MATAQLSTLNPQLSTLVSRLSSLVLLVLLPAAAAAGPVTLEETTAIAPQRLGGPIYLTGQLHYHGAGIAEGVLEFEVRSGGKTIVVLRSEPKVLMEGVTRFRRVLPMLPTSKGTYGVTEVVVHFVSDAGRDLLREIPVQLAARINPPRVLLQVRGNEDSRDGAERMRELFDFAEVAAIAKTNSFFSPALLADELPEQSLAYCAFGGVTVTSGGFAEMSGRQLDALSEWIRAGGSACIHVEDGDYFKPKHREFLNTIFVSGPAPWLLDDDGHLRRGGDDWTFSASRSGVGFAIVTRAPPPQDSPEWRRVLAQFWHVGILRRELIVGSGGSNERERRRGLQMAGGGSYRMSGILAARTLGGVPPIGRKIFQVLRPRDIHLLPGWALVGVLVFYVVLVGPVDYFFLGWFKKRRWTWVIFPLVTVLMTAGLIVTANAFMATSITTRTLTIIDCDAAGKPVRINTFEFLFENRSREYIFRGEGETFSRLHPAYFQSEFAVFNRGPVVFSPGGNRMAATGLEQSAFHNDAPTGPYRGVFPGQYTVSQRLGKWTPQVNRMMSFAPSIEMPEIDWERASDRETRVIELRDGRTARVFHVAGRKDDGSQRRVFRGRRVPVAGGRNARVMLPVTVSGAVARMASHDLVELVTFRAPGRTGRSPLGLGWLDDLPLVDPLDPKSRAIVVKLVAPDGSITLYRKYP